MILIKGREIFESYKKLINFGSAIFNLFPNFIIIVILKMFENTESKLALLLRYFYLKKNLALCGDNIFVGKYVTLKNIENLRLGSNVSIHAYCYLDAVGEIEIGDNVSIASHTSIFSFEHTWKSIELPIKYNPVVNSKVNINHDVWVGTGCRILSGVTIGSRSIVAAGAVVTKNVKSKTIVGGMPAKVIKEI